MKNIIVGLFTLIGVLTVSLIIYLFGYILGTITTTNNIKSSFDCVVKDSIRKDF